LEFPANLVLVGLRINGSVHTDPVPRKASEKEEYQRSDSMAEISLPPAEPIRALALTLKEALLIEDKKAVSAACAKMLVVLAQFYGVEPPGIKILNARPLKTSEKWIVETFGDYSPDTARIRLWMRTAVQKKATSYGVMLNTLVHEFFHHLDMVSLNLPETYHTRGFYERVGLLYHHIQDTPVKKIVWRSQSDGTYHVDWGKTMSRSSAK
jgi:hypothetical protein